MIFTSLKARLSAMTLIAIIGPFLDQQLLRGRAFLFQCITAIISLPPAILHLYYHDTLTHILCYGGLIVGIYFSWYKPYLYGSPPNHKVLNDATSIYLQHPFKKTRAHLSAHV